MNGMTWADAVELANSGFFTVQGLTADVAGKFGDEDSHLCPGVPKRVIWSAVRLALENRTGPILPNTELADVAALYLYEFQPKFEQI
jgi:hypothetical protein